MKTYKETLISKCKKHAIVHGIFAVIIMIVIFIFSSQKGYESSSLSGSVFEFISKILSPVMPESFMSFLETYIRKLAHVSIYFLLGIFTSLCSIWIYKYRIYKGLITVCTKLRAFFHYFTGWAVALLYAVSDEIHQAMVPGRSCEIADMGLDSLSAIVGTLLVALFSIRSIRKAGKFIAEEERPYNPKAI